MASSAVSVPTFQAVNANIANDGSADSPRGYAISTNADYTFTASGASRARVTATSANCSVNLPSTDVQAGKEYEVVTSCSGGFTIAIKSSDGDTIDTLKGSKGRIRLVAVTSPFTDGTHWEVVEVYDEGDWTPTFTNLTVGNGTTYGTFVRTGGQCLISGGITFGTTSAMGTAPTITNLPFSVIDACNMVFGDSGTTIHFGAGVVTGGTVSFIKTGAGSVVNATTPMTWTNLDTFVCHVDGYL